MILYQWVLQIAELMTKTGLRVSKGVAILESMSIFEVLLVAPFLEELVYRLWLNQKRRNIIISFFFFALGIFYWYRGRSELGIDMVFYLCLLLLFVISYKGEGYIANPALMMILSCFIFGIVHLTSLPNYKTLPFFIIFLNTFPHMLSGFFLAKVRIELGIQFSMAFHFIINGVALLLSHWIQYASSA